MKAILGIDLGTTNSAMAVWNGTEPHLLPNNRGSRITPSVVAMADGGEILVGESAVNQAVINARNTVHAVKRHIGSGHTFNLRGATLSAEEVSACIIRKLRHDAEEYLGTQIHDAVITVPAYFSEKQRRATVEAGRLAGLRVRRVLNEPTAAALAYASRQPADRIILVYDLGGGTFDVTCLRQSGMDFEVLSTAGDAELGGLDFTRLLLNDVKQGFTAKAGISLDDPVICRQLEEAVERGKIELSSRDSVEIGFPFIGSDGRPLHLNRRVHRIEFNRLIGGLVERSVHLTMEALRQAEVRPEELDGLVLSGGSSRIPLIRHRLQETLGCGHVSQVNPDEIVALGAAIQASMLIENRDMSLRDVTAFDLGVEIEHGRFIPIVQRNSALPASSRRIFTTITDGQTVAEIHVLQGNHETAAKNSSLGRFMLSGIKQDAKGQPRIEIEFRVDNDGLVEVAAVDKDTGARHRVTLSSTSGGGIDDSTAGLRSRVQSLIRRLETACRESAAQLDRDFLQESREVCSLARRSVLQQDNEALRQVKSALETLLIEIHSIGGITHESIS